MKIKYIIDVSHVDHENDDAYILVDTRDGDTGLINRRVVDIIVDATSSETYVTAAAALKIFVTT